MQITENYLQFKKGIPENVSLVAVSKTKPEEDILELYNQGHKLFGENKVQELVRKSENLPADIEWHMIGHLQSNKVKYLAPFIHLIHGVDSFKLLKTINKEAVKNKRTIPCLIQMHIAREVQCFARLVRSHKYRQWIDDLNADICPERLNYRVRLANVKIIGLEYAVTKRAIQ